MRLLHCISSLDPAGGGPIESLRLRVTALAARGHASEVACLDAPGAAWLTGFPATVHALGPARGGYRYSARWVPWVRANHARFDAIIVNGLWQFNSLGTWCALPRGFPYFVFPHGMLDPWFKRTYPLKHLKKWLYWPWADYRVLRHARAVLFTSQEERRLAAQSFWLYRCTERVVNYGTAGPSGDAAHQAVLFRAQFPETAGRRCLLFLGRVHVKKGPALLLHALQTVLAEMPDATRHVHLVMGGPHDHAYGHEMVALAQRLGLEARITWTGLLRGDLKWGGFHAADAFILPSHQENFGVAVAEALACGVPVLLSKQVNIWREIADSRCGLVEPDTLEGTTALLRRWLGTPPAEWNAMKARATTTFAERFHIDHAAESLERVLHEFVPASRGTQTPSPRGY